MDLNPLYKAGGILIKNKKFMLEKHGDNDVFIIPGGKLEFGETAKEALIREFNEEFHLEIDENDIYEFGSFRAQAVHSPDKIVKIEVFIVHKWKGRIRLDDGIEQVVWVDSRNIGEYKVSPITSEILPLLLNKSYIN